MDYKKREILNNRNAIFSLCEQRSLNRMWRHFSLDDAYAKISGVFCSTPAGNSLFSSEIIFKLVITVMSKCTLLIPKCDTR